MTQYFFSALAPFVRFAFAIPVFILLLRAYDRTRMRSFLWLIVSLVVWPLAATLLSMFLPLAIARIASERALPASSTVSMFGEVYLVEALIGGTLLLVSIVMLERDLTARMEPTPTLPPPIPAA